jgi:hypothetical protein
MWPTYFSKISWQRKSWPIKGETDSKGMMIFARPSGFGYPSQLVAKLHMEPQRYTLSGLLCSTRISYPADPLGMVSVKNPNGHTDKMRKSKSEQSAQTRYNHRRKQVHGQFVRKSNCPSAPCRASLKMLMFEVCYTYKFIPYFSRQKAVKSLVDIPWSS